MTISMDQLNRRPILDLSTAKTVGEISHPILDATRHRVIAFQLTKAVGPANVLPWESINAIGPDAVTISNTDQLREPTGSAERRALEVGNPIGRPVITTQGKNLGSLQDIAADEHSGAVESIMLATGTCTATTVGIGNYALIVQT